MKIKFINILKNSSEKEGVGKMKLTQCDVILKAMLENPNKVEWSAKDFQNGEYFVGYEASARMSDLLRMYPEILIAGKEGRLEHYQ